jgi:hypothetical protein
MKVCGLQFMVVPDSWNYISDLNISLIIIKNFIIIEFTVAIMAFLV